ncbi:hypothetical protein V1478_011801 [Vespula squamosa]|uniref:Ribosomal protein L20 n=1 Tax=Vespula squamosa TaxID=30214 RepID=A0ABD2ADL8_VESSQ
MVEKSTRTHRSGKWRHTNEKRQKRSIYTYIHIYIYTKKKEKKVTSSKGGLISSVGRAGWWKKRWGFTSHKIQRGLVKWAMSVARVCTHESGKRGSLVPSRYANM